MELVFRQVHVEPEQHQWVVVYAEYKVYEVYNVVEYEEVYEVYMVVYEVLNTTSDLPFIAWTDPLELLKHGSWNEED